MFLKLVHEYWIYSRDLQNVHRRSNTSIQPLQKMSEGTSKSRFEHNCTRYNTGKGNSRDFISKLIVEIVGEYAEDNLTDYVERTINPRVLKYRHWIRRIRQMNIYLSQIAGPTKNIQIKES